MGLIIGLIILGLLVTGGLVYWDGWQRDTDPVAWCERHQPQLNGSRASVCYHNPVWEEYCKISWPTHCPNNQVTK